MFTEIVTMLKTMSEVRRNQRLSRAELERLKLEKFRKLVRFVNERSPYYADLIRDLGIDIARCVPTDFPVLTKSIVMENFDRLVTDRRITKQGVANFLTRSVDPNDLLFGDYRVLHTSGSSGEVGYFLYSKSDWAKGMSVGFRSSRERPRPKKSGFRRWRMAYYAAIGGHFAGVSMISSARRGLGRLFMDIRLFEVNDPLPKILDDLNVFQPDFL